MSRILEVENVHSGYGKVEILHGATLGVEKGEIACLIGPNGCGKSTLFKTIFGILKAWSGKIVFANADITNHKPHMVIERGIGYVPQGRGVFATLSVEENLRMGAFTRNDRKIAEDIQKVKKMFPILGQRSSTKAALLSGGEQQMLVMARALLLSPILLLVDEPSLGLEPKFIELVFEKLKEINRNGTTLLIIEQNARRALQLADHAFVLDLGKTRFEGRGSEVLANEEIQRLYLGAA